jgi:hypothetical protein
VHFSSLNAVLGFKIVEEIGNLNQISPIEKEQRAIVMLVNVIKKPEINGTEKTIGKASWIDPVYGLQHGFP